MIGRIQGIITAVVTPFDDDENVNEKAFREIIDYLIDNGVSGLFPVGTTGEFFSLTLQEKQRLIDVAVEHTSGRVFVMPNTGCITTSESVSLSRYAEKAGADCISVVTPFFISPSQDELYDHYRAICESVEIPVLAYNNPARTGGLFLEAQTLARLAQDLPNFAGIKDSTGNMSHFAEIIRLTPPDFSVIMGNDALIFIALMLGASGAVAATSNIAPKLVVGIYEAFKSGDYEKAKQYQQSVAPLRKGFSLGSFPAMTKEALNMLGLPAGKCRSPVGPLSQQEKLELRQILQDAELLS